MKHTRHGQDDDTRSARIHNRSARRPLRQATAQDAVTERALRDTARTIVLQNLGSMAFRTTRDGLPRHVEDSLVDAVCREVCRRHGGNDVVNRLEAEALVHTVLRE